MIKKFAVVVFALVFSLAFWNGEISGAAASGSTQTVSGGGVTAKVTYLNPKSGNDARFAVVLETHSVDLDAYDLKALSLLRDQTGKQYFPTEVENKGSGHHREITLIFPRLPAEAKRVELVIKDVAGVKERVFRWSQE